MSTTQIASPGSIALEDVIKTEVLETRFFNCREYTLKHVSDGWEPAGAAMRWTDGYFAVHTIVGGAINGRRFKTEAEARGTLDAWEAQHAADMAMPCCSCGHPMSEHGERYACPS